MFCQRFSLSIMVIYRRKRQSRELKGNQKRICASEQLRTPPGLEWGKAAVDSKEQRTSMNVVGNSVIH